MRLFFDLETDGLLDTVSKVHCIHLKDADTGQKYGYHGADVQVGIQKLADADWICGHNIIKYDLPVLDKLHPGWRAGHPQTIRDTIVCTRLIWTDLSDRDFAFQRRDPSFPKNLINRHSLKAWGWRIGLHKGDYGETTDWKKWTPEMDAYCSRDVDVTEALWKLIESKQYSEQAIQLEHDFAQVIFLQEQHGFCFDEKAAGDLYAQLAQQRMDLVAKLREVFPPRILTMKTPAYHTLRHLSPSGHVEESQHASKGDAETYRKQHKWRPKDCTIEPGPMVTKELPFEPSSRQQIAKRLIEKYGWKPVDYTDGGDVKIDETILARLEYPECPLLVEYLKVDKTIGQLAEGDNAWLKLSKNGRIHGNVTTNGCVTGRCSHQKPNVAQTPKVEVRKVDGKKVVLMGLAGGWGWECRSLYTADPGWKLVGADASGLELRCLAHYLAPFDNGAYIEAVIKGDVHTVNQHAAGLDTRDKAKTFIYANNYGAGCWKLGFIAGVTEVEKTEYMKSRAWGKPYWRRHLERRGLPVTPHNIALCIKGDKLKRQFLARTPGMQDLLNAIAGVLASRSYLIGVDGRRLHVRAKYLSLNTLLQSAGGLIVKLATVLAYRTLTERGYVFGKDYANVAHIHDELQITCRPEIADEVGKVVVESIKAAGIALRFRCPLDGEYKIGDTWAQTH